MSSIFKDKRRIIFVIYTVMFFYFMFKMFFYAVLVGRFPDEMAHISYIAYLIQNHSVIPDFKNMTILENVSGSKVTDAISAKMGYGGAFKFGKSFNYLGHPPLYYQIMRLSGGVIVHNGVVTIDIFRLRAFSIMLAAAALFLMFYIGYSRLGNVPAIHLLYAAVCVSVPMLSYDCAGVNNDTLALLGVAIILLGLLRFSVKQRDYITFTLLGFGIAVTLLAKLVAGMAICVSILFFLFFTIKEEKKLSLFSLKSILPAIPACLLVIAYFYAVYKTTGTIQPTFRKLCPQQFYASTFYVSLHQRSKFNFGQYSVYYWNAFLRTWTGIYSHVKLQKAGNFLSLNQFGLAFLWLLPLPLFLQFKKKFHYPILTTLLALYMGLLSTAGFQFFRAYHEFKSVSGYLGGYQSRYYLCMIPFIGLAAVCSFGFFYDSKISLFQSKSGEATELTETQWKIRRYAVLIFCYLYTCLLIYEDFVYFIMNFKDYI